MNTKSLLLPIAAALALTSLPARAQHDHGTMNHAAKPTSAAAHGIVEGTVKDGVRVVEMAVTDEGFVPSKIKAKKGEKLRLVITRKTDSTCAKEIVIKELSVNQALPLNKVVTVELTPAKSGELRFACGMDHISGVVFIP